MIINGRYAAAAFAGVALLSGARSSHAAQSRISVPALVNLVATAYVADVRGIIGVQRHFSTVIKAGPIQHSEISDSGLLLRDGHYVGIRYYRIADDGHALSNDKIAQRNTQTNADWSAGKVFFKEPYDPRFLDDYRFQPTSSPSLCGSDVAVAFSSATRDAQHGNGTMCIHLSDFSVPTLTYVPNAFPPHASSGSVTETSARVPAGPWYVTRIDETYGGHAFIIHGSATFTGKMDHFRRFQSVSSGEAALKDATI